MIEPNLTEQDWAEQIQAERQRAAEQRAAEQRAAERAAAQPGVVEHGAVELVVEPGVDASVADASVVAEAPAEPAEPAVPSVLDTVRAAHTLAQQLEALLIVADEPLSAVTLATACDRPLRDVRAALDALVAEFNGTDDTLGAGPRGFELREIGGGYRFYVRESLDPLVADFVQQQSPSKLSQAALETLAVIAYRQPIARGAIASIRAVNVDSVVRTLLARGLVTEVGHDAETGATLYGTTETLLAHLGVDDIGALPSVAPLLDDGSEGFDHESH